jgi:ABC-2 type transport system permease protein
MGRTWAIVEREMRRFRRSPVLIAMSMMMPIVQLVVLGYAFGGQRQAPEAGHRGPGPRDPRRARREMTSAVASGATPSTPCPTPTRPGPDRPAQRQGERRAHHPARLLRRVLARNDPRLALIEDNTDNFVSVALAGTLSNMLASYSPSVKLEARVVAEPRLDVVEVYPTCPTCSTCCRARW